MEILADLIMYMSIKEGLDAQNLGYEAPNQVDGSGKITNQIDLHQVKSRRNGLANLSRHISRSDSNTGKENLPNRFQSQRYF